MKNPRLRLFAALLFPMIVLAGNAWMNHQQRSAGEAFTLPIHGFDPRDLLSGHYLYYRIDYGINESNGCPASDIAALLCLSPERRIYPEDELPASCKLFLQGDCDASAVFSAGLERYYIPEEHTRTLEDKVRENKGELVLSIDRRGNAAIRELLIEGKPWKEWIEQSPK